VQPRFWKQRARAPECLKYSRGHLVRATAHFAALTEARTGLPADDAEIERAAKDAARRWAKTGSPMNPPEPPRHDGVAALVERARSLILQNDPDAVLAGLTEIAAALDAFAGTA
jgi:hypothetical protein